MRKIIFIFLFISIIASTLFANSTGVDIITQVDEVALDYRLYRKSNDTLTLLKDGETYVIDNLNPLSTNTMITDFTIRVNSNLTSPKNVSVKITPKSFKTVLNGTQIYDSKSTPIINTIIDRKIVAAGINKDKEVYRFNMYIVGKPNLPAGQYISNVDIEYIIE